MPRQPPVLSQRSHASLPGIAPDDRKRAYDKRRAQASPWRNWYKLALWRGIRQAQLDAEPLCRMCRAGPEQRVTLATVCDHVEPHRGDWEKFTGGPFQSLCEACHSGEKQRIEADRGGRGRVGSGKPV